MQSDVQLHIDLFIKEAYLLSKTSQPHNVNLVRWCFVKKSFLIIKNTSTMHSGSYAQTMLKISKSFTNTSYE